MSDIKITLDEQNSLEFDADIQGIDTDNIDVRFVIEANGMDLSFNGKMKDSTVTVNIPILSEHLKANEYDCRLEFIVEGTKYFAPMKAKIDAIMPVRITAGLKEAIKKTESVFSKIAESASVKVEEKISVEPKVKVKKEKTFKDRAEENLDSMALAENVEELTSIYKKNISLNENENIDLKGILVMIDPICQNKLGLSFFEYVEKIREE